MDPENRDEALENRDGLGNGSQKGRERKNDNLIMPFKGSRDPNLALWLVQIGRENE